MNLQDATAYQEALNRTLAELAEVIEQRDQLIEAAEALLPEAKEWFDLVDNDRGCVTHNDWRLITSLEVAVEKAKK